MDNDGFAQDFPDAEMVGQEHLQRPPVIPQQRRKIPTVVRVGTAGRVIVSIRVCKGVLRIPAAPAAAVNVKGEKALDAGSRLLGKSAYVRSHQDALGCLVKSHHTM